MSNSGELNGPGSRFVGRWKVTEGNMGSVETTGDLPVPNYAIIKAEKTTSQGWRYRLFSQVGDEPEIFRQELKFDEPSQTLVNLDKDGERGRCIAFWGRKGRKPRSEKDSIFAKRIKRDDPTFSSESLLPWEKGDDGGTWGAEDG